MEKAFDGVRMRDDQNIFIRVSLTDFQEARKHSFSYFLIRFVPLYFPPLTFIHRYLSGGNDIAALNCPKVPFNKRCLNKVFSLRRDDTQDNLKSLLGPF